MAPQNEKTGIIGSPLSSFIDNFNVSEIQMLLSITLVQARLQLLLGFPFVQRWHPTQGTLD